MADYRLVTAQFDRVRRAWTRATLLSGLTALAVDLLALFGVGMLANALFDLHWLTRALLLAAGLVFAVVLARRLVFGQMSRRISDREIALFIEEHNPGFEGALLAASEFGAQGEDNEVRRQLVEAIIASAAERAGKFKLASALDLGRLRKYAVCAALLVAIYLAAALTEPELVRTSALKTINPLWTPPAKQTAQTGRQGRRLLQTEKSLPQLEIALMRNDKPLDPVSAIRRGSNLVVEAILNRDPIQGKEPLAFNFRPLAASNDPQAAWMPMEMEQIEKLHGYRINLPDVNEDLEFNVTCGTVHTTNYVVNVFDPLTIGNFKIVMKPPKYLDRPDETIEKPTGDIRAYVDSTVGVQLQANNKLGKGTIVWGQGDAAQPMQLDGNDSRTASVSFNVSKTTSYTVKLNDLFGQELVVQPPCLVEALKDQPPSVTLKTPRNDIVTHPLGELTIQADASDDIGLAAVDMIYTKGSDAAGVQKKSPLPLASRLSTQATNAPLTAATGSIRIEFEDFPGGSLKVGDMLTFFVQATDKKGQVAASDVFFIYIRPFEDWGFWLVRQGGETMKAEAQPTRADPISKFVAAAWHLRASRDRMSQKEFDVKCEQLGAAVGQALSSGAWANEP